MCSVNTANNGGFWHLLKPKHKTKMYLTLKQIKKNKAPAWLQVFLLIINKTVQVNCETVKTNDSGVVISSQKYYSVRKLRLGMLKMQGSALAQINRILSLMPVDVAPSRHHTILTSPLDTHAKRTHAHTPETRRPSWDDLHTQYKMS